ncbi:hypothetical protein AVEN_238474-1 [Araneus ventricosus]|uniref:DDE-1 domain-containing protein n=1 Tax=Araneus ventricosus TaxID=182803 RepID=A0A4Y2L7F6_ARAVE|nr:hypothetical protein AVEN_238474-1 [Araneus ventricosus]
MRVLLRALQFYLKRIQQSETEMSWKGEKKRIRCSSYTAESMRLAYLSVKSGQYTGRKAAAMFEVPYGTLNKKLSGRAPVEAHGAGRPNEISAESEQKFSEYLKIAGKYGYGYSRCEIQDLVSEFVKEEGIKTRWSDGKPGYQWLTTFLRRHPEINCRKDDHIAHEQLNNVDPFMVYQFYDDLKVLYANENITDSDSDRVYNVCEILLHNNFAEPYAFPTRCAKCISKIAVDDSELDTSVVVSVSADGEKLHPLILFHGRCVLPSRMTNKKAPGTTYYTASAQKWMEGTLFSYWFENVFIPQLPSKVARCGKSVVLLFDGSSLQVNIRCLAEAMKHNVILVKLPPKLNKHLQPLSRTCLSVLKSAWDHELISWEGENLATIQKLFGQLLGITWNQHFGKRIIRKAFQTTGVFPPDKNWFPVNVFAQKALKRYTRRGQITVRKRRVKVKVEDEPVTEPAKVLEEVVPIHPIIPDPIYPIIPDPIYQVPDFSKAVKPNIFQRFIFKKRSSSSKSSPLDLSKRKKSSDNSEEIPIK